MATEAHTKDASGISTLLLPGLENRRDWDDWRRNEIEAGTDRQTIITMLEAEGSPLAMLRAGGIYATLGDFDGWKMAASRALVSHDSAVRMLAKISLVNHEACVAVAQASDPTEIKARLLPPLLAKREDFNESVLALEAQYLLLSELADAYWHLGEYDRCVEYASEALVFAKMFGERHEAACRLQIAQGLTRSGQFAQAIPLLTELVAAHNIAPAARMYSAINRAIVALLQGDDAIAFLDFADEQQLTVVYQQLAAAFRGRLSVVKPASVHVREEYPKMLLALQAVRMGDEQGAIDAVIGFPAAPLWQWFPHWIQQLVGRDGQGKLPSNDAHLVRLLLAAARCELLMKRWHPPRIALEECAEILNNVPLRFQPILVETLIVWHPLVAATLAFSPLMNSLLLESARQAVWRDGRPITIYGQGVGVRVPFVEATLEAFGISIINRRASSEQKKLDAVLTQGGFRRRMIPPAVVVFHLLHCGWYDAARKLADSHGILPELQTGALKCQSLELRSAFHKLLSRSISPNDFINRLL
jgi:tetratricopeptide (TPR) repeat protein